MTFVITRVVRFVLILIFVLILLGSVRIGNFTQDSKTEVTFNVFFGTDIVIKQEDHKEYDVNHNSGNRAIGSVIENAYVIDGIAVIGRFLKDIKLIVRENRADIIDTAFAKCVRNLLRSQPFAPFRVSLRLPKFQEHGYPRGF